jgi:hypothetical protein
VQKKWTVEPELVIPPLRKCEIVDRVESPNERITRNLVPKRKSKDPILKEQVEYHASNGLLQFLSKIPIPLYPYAYHCMT